MEGDMCNISSKSCYVTQITISMIHSCMNSSIHFSLHICHLCLADCAMCLLCFSQSGMSHKRTAEEPEEDVAEQQYDDDEQYEGDNNADDRPAADDGEPVIRFRSYMPRDETLQVSDKRSYYYIQENVVQSDLPEIVTKPEFGVDVSEILQSHSEFLQKDVSLLSRSMECYLIGGDIGFSAEESQLGFEA